MRYLLVIILASTIGAADASARAVSLADATVAPTVLRLVAPHHTASVPLACAYSLTDVSAYRWNGNPLSAQRWTTDGTVTYWATVHHRRVTFDGRTFRNGARVPVLVAAWCDA